jgi:hypothetical protein
MFAKFLAAIMGTCLLGAAPARSAITLENRDLRLVIGEDGQALSLVEKASGQECLAPGTKTSAFSLIVDRPNHTDLWVAYPSKRTAYAANHVRREGDRLLVGFELVAQTAVIRVKNTENYIGFTLEKVEGRGDFSEVRFLQLPVRNRKNFGNWLNVMWDDDVAVNVLATDPYAQIDADPHANYHVLWASAVSEVKMEEVGAALIATRTPSLLQRIARLEEDFGLPKGAQSRQRPEYKWSQMIVGVASGKQSIVTPGNVDRYLAFAKQAGLRAIQVYYTTFAQSAGHFEWRPEYPNGMEDLKALAAKIVAAGLLPGLHVHYNKATKTDAYVTPVADPRLHLRTIFTLAAPLEEQTTVVQVFENPRGSTMESERRFLQLEDELITYKSYTTSPPYRFLGCRRGALNTHPAAHRKGLKFGLLDVDDWPIFIRFDQRTDIEAEVAKRIAPLYNLAGFRFAYFDGAEDVHNPYWFTTSWAQWQVYQLIQPEPLFAEAAAHSHFSWHMMSRMNAFDGVPPEKMKEFIRLHPAEEAPRSAQDFSHNNFGWLYFYLPTDKSLGSQVDIYEYAASRAAAWDCPISLAADPDKFDAHPRTPDILEAIRRWEQMREQLTAAQRESLRNLNQEHTLVLNEKDQLELVPYEQIPNVAGAERPIRAFVFQRAGNICVVYWHISGEGVLRVPLPRSRVELLEDLRKELPLQGDAHEIRLPAAGRRYLKCTGLTRAAVISAFQKAVVENR